MSAASALLVHVPPGFLRWWQAKSGRERQIILAVAAVIAVAILWLALWLPLQRDLLRARIAAVADHRLVASAQRMADEIASLARTAPPPAPTDLQGALERMLTQRGLRTAVTQLDWQDGRARLVMASVSFDSLITTLEALQRQTGLRIVEATLTALVQPGSVRAELVLAR